MSTQTTTRMQKEVRNLGTPWEQSYGYSQAVRVGDTIWVSGQLSHDDEANMVTPRLAFPTQLVEIKLVARI
jgi:enamine deaminase RidA (YjgF/YER057c/UK114 family)